MGFVPEQDDSVTIHAIVAVGESLYLEPVIATFDTYKLKDEWARVLTL